MIVLVTGSRDWEDRVPIESRLDALEASTAEDRLILVEGGARGADRIAAGWGTRAQRRGITWKQIQAKWEEHHPAWCPGSWCAVRRHCVGAGHRRNQEMMDWVLASARSGESLLVLAFKDGFDLSKGTGGTEDCVQRAKDARIPGRVIQHAGVCSC